MKQTKRILWGVVLIAVGAVLGLNALNVVDVDLFFDGWWALFIIVPCTIGLLTDYDKTGDVIGLLVGVLLLLACQGVLDAGMLFKLVVPVVIILIGLRMIFKGIFSRGHKEAATRADAAGRTLREYSAVFSGASQTFAGEEFSGGEFTAAFGRLNCDLTDAVITDEAVIRANGIFGRVVVTLPENVDVIVSSSALFGGVSNQYAHRSGGGAAGAIRVYISGNCAFGGVTIR